MGWPNTSKIVVTIVHPIQKVNVTESFNERYTFTEKWIYSSIKYIKQITKVTTSVLLYEYLVSLLNDLTWTSHGHSTAAGV